jgi:hypothetical protein
MRGAIRLLLRFAVVWRVEAAALGVTAGILPGMRVDCHVAHAAPAAMCSRRLTDAVGSQL